MASTLLFLPVTTTSVLSGWDWRDISPRASPILKQTFFRLASFLQNAAVKVILGKEYQSYDEALCELKLENLKFEVCEVCEEESGEF